jgi:phage-related protein
MLQKEVEALEMSLKILKEGFNYENNEKVGVAIRALQSVNSMPSNAFLKNSKKYLKHLKQSTTSWPRRLL